MACARRPNRGSIWLERSWSAGTIGLSADATLSTSTSRFDSGGRSWGGCGSAPTTTISPTKPAWREAIAALTRPRSHRS
jgi:hypothetical protein